MSRTQRFLTRTSNIISHHRRRAREAGRPLDYGLEELRSLVLEALSLPCCYCGLTLTDANFGIDHATPTSRGGSLGRDNLRVCCMRCNEIKGRLDDEEFSALLALLAAWPSEARTDVLMRLRAGGRVRR